MLRAHNGPLRLQNPVAQETYRRKDEPEAIRPEQFGIEGTSRLGLADEAEGEEAE